MFYVNKPIAKLYNEIGDTSISDELLYGWEVKVLREEGDFYYIETKYRYYGYVKKGDLTEGIYKDCFYVVNQSADILPLPTYKSLEIITVFSGSRLHVLEEKDGFLKVQLLSGHEGFVKKNLVCKMEIKLFNETDNEEQMRNGIVNAALLFFNIQYRWGGKTSLGIDCSGLAFMSYMLNGAYIYRDAKIPEGFPVTEIEKEKLKKGDLIYSPGHVMIYAGNDTIIHSSMSNGRVATNSINENSPDFFAPLNGVELKYGSIFK